MAEFEASLTASLPWRRAASLRRMTERPRPWCCGRARSWAWSPTATWSPPRSGRGEGRAPWCWARAASSSWQSPARKVTSKKFDASTNFPESGQDLDQDLFLTVFPSPAPWRPPQRCLGRPWSWTRRGRSRRWSWPGWWRRRRRGERPARRSCPQRCRWRILQGRRKIRGTMYCTYVDFV